MKKALIIVDVQNDFCDGGSLPVSRGGSIVPAINSIQSKFDIVVTTQDCHPPDHISFTHWPTHCVKGTPGVQFHPMLDLTRVNNNFVKGTDKDHDSYSGFFDDMGKGSGLALYLREKGITEVYICGLATEYCVKATAIDAAHQGFNTTVITDGIKGIDMEKCTAALRAMELNGCSFRSSCDI